MPPADPIVIAADLLAEARALDSAARMVARRLSAAPSDGLGEIADRATSALRAIRRSIAEALVDTELFDRERGRV